VKAEFHMGKPAGTAGGRSRDRDIDHILEAKEYLGRAHRMREFIAAREEQLAELREAALRVNSFGAANLGKRTDYKGYTEAVVCKIMDLETAITKDIGDMVDAMKEIRASIYEVEDKSMRLLLEMRYLNFKTMEDICEQIGYSERHIYRVHEEALRRVRLPYEKSA